MTDFEYILKQGKRFQYKGCSDDDIKQCVDRLGGLSRQELIVLYSSRWFAWIKPIRDEIFRLLYMDKKEMREERVKELTTNQLISDFEERKRGNVTILRQELRQRFLESIDDDRNKIAAAFNRATKGDRRWVDLQIRKEQRFEKLPF
jgi:hypothetical protein